MKTILLSSIVVAILLTSQVSARAGVAEEKGADKPKSSEQPDRESLRAAKVARLRQQAAEARAARMTALDHSSRTSLLQLEAKTRLLANLLSGEALDDGDLALARAVRSEHSIEPKQRVEIAILSDMVAEKDKSLASPEGRKRFRETAALALVHEFPSEPTAFERLFTVALASDTKRALEFARQVVDSPASLPTRNAAGALIARLTADGMYFADAIAEVSGFSGLFAKVHGHLAVFYTWHPEDEESIQRALSIGAALPSGARAIGINLSSDLAAALKVAADRALPGEQLANARGYDHPAAIKMGLTVSQVIYAISREGRIRNLSAEQDLAAALANLD